MPTGYTAAVQSGDMTSLREFALYCARGMGSLIMMRDDALDAEIPARFEPSAYHAERLVEVQIELAALRAMSPAEWQAAADAELARHVEAAAKYAAEKDEQKHRYQAMLSKVEAWENPPEGIKNFMIEQLQKSIEFDCSDTKYWRDLTPKDGVTWKVEREQKLMEDSAYQASEAQKEIDRTESRNAWIAHLRASLDGVE